MVHGFRNGAFRFKGVGRIPQGNGASSEEGNKGITGG